MKKDKERKMARQKEIDKRITKIIKKQEEEKKKRDDDLVNFLKE